MSKRKPTPDEEPKKETISDEESGDETNPGDETKKEKTSDEESRDETNPGGSAKCDPGDSSKGEAKKMPDPKISARQPGNGVIKTVLGAAVVAGLFVTAPPLFISMLGFTKAGIAVGSVAAKMMSAAAIANGGGVAAGSPVAVLQSVGAAGFSLGTNIGLGTSGAACGGLLMKLLNYKSKNDKNPSEKPKKK